MKLKLPVFLPVCLLGIAFQASTFAQSAKTGFKFDFGPGKTATGYTKILPSNTYAKETGYGFDFGTTVSAVERGGKDAGKDGFVASDKPFYFSVAVPEGNYNVTVTLGDAKGKSATMLKAESRRLLAENISTESGKFVTRTFTINVKSRQISTGGTVYLKPRELNKLDWDEKLTLEFDGTTCLNALEITPAKDVVTVFLAGNSTVVNQDDEPWAAWGQMIPRFFKPGVAIANHAESGLTLGSFLGSHRLEKVLSVMKPGDYLFIEFGHNDQKEKGVNDGAFKSYTERLKLFVSEAKKKGGIPVIVTSTARRNFDEATGKNVNSLGDYPEAARKVAQEEQVALIDLNAMTTTLYEAMGVEESKKAFVHYPANSYPNQPQPLADNTHFNPYGAYEIAKCIVEGIKANRLAISKFLINDTPAFNPAKPDALTAWHWIESPRSAVTKPDGN
ncbi:rhamnogalacturonan acetylesterase [Hymenobacter sp. BT491]|uniref:rhamnogalacturonan acetylesterase n=1 Tax=Hymenobacter sp. BT491 TaxID=2766779 RepID=UPI0016534B5B|nr:GDSL-type esterase/lipase family protein [Hymenobacter sp. BT491]MBC6989625.1 rhamnogalacturonan acetylesterase [Hymenobacter sp. BT491]